jgi:hypothetical protein
MFVVSNLLRNEYVLTILFPEYRLSTRFAFYKKIDPPKLADLLKYIIRGNTLHFHYDQLYLVLYTKTLF